MRLCRLHDLNRKSLCTASALLLWCSVVPGHLHPRMSAPVGTHAFRATRLSRKWVGQVTCYFHLLIGVILELDGCNSQALVRRTNASGFQISLKEETML